jgi:hypothetical protein
MKYPRVPVVGMSREIRITVDDDEVFERMKRRKRELDLSWEDVLRRGLGRGGGSDLDAVKDEFARRIQDQVAASLRASMPGASGPSRSPGSRDPFADEFWTDAEDDDGDDFDDEIADLAEAEDATLAFPSVAGLSDEMATQVPLRVRLRFDGGDLAVTVVTVRQGKSVAEANSFPGDARRRLVEHLATGGTAALRLGDGSEEYRVRPALDWGRDEDGRPTVTGVEVDEVVFDASE